MFACEGILAALFDRERTGKGRRIELSMFDAMLHLLTYIGTMWLTNAELPKPPGSAHDYTVPWQAFEARDGYVVIATREDVFWRRLCEALAEPGLAEDPRFATNELRVENRALLVPRLEHVIRQRSVAEWLEVLRSAQVPAAPVNNLDRAFAEPPVAERQMIVEYDHPDVGRVRMPGNPIKMSGVTNSKSTPAPRLGEHTDHVLGELLALSPRSIAQLRADGAIR
jgi:crotonobetainyl-CoA:carnitine CoA-transferase CaiB-like acyl-CoA transferase